MRNFDQFRRRMELELEEEWNKFQQLPRIELPPGVSMQLIPPSVGALARIILWKGDRRLSIYFDAHDALGCVGKPYYELYPNLEGDISRFLVGEEEQFAAAIAAIFA